MFRDLDHWKKYADSDLLRELMEAYYKKGGNKPLAVTYYGVRHTTANKPIVEPKDMAGLKLRVPDAPLYVMYPKTVGANATPIAFAEVYLALQSKTVDAQENPLPTIEAKKFYEVQSHINLTGHITEMLLTIVSGQTWGKLSDADKKTFETVFREAAAKATSQIESVGGQARQRLRDQVRQDRRQVRSRRLRQGLPEGAPGQLRDLGQGHLRPAAGPQVVRRCEPRRSDDAAGAAQRLSDERVPDVAHGPRRLTLGARDGH